MALKRPTNWLDRLFQITGILLLILFIAASFYSDPSMFTTFLFNGLYCSSVALLIIPCRKREIVFSVVQLGVLVVLTVLLIFLNLFFCIEEAVGYPLMILAFSSQLCFFYLHRLELLKKYGRLYFMKYTPDDFIAVYKQLILRMIYVIVVSLLYFVVLLSAHPLWMDVSACVLQFFFVTLIFLSSVSPSRIPDISTSKTSVRVQEEHDAVSDELFAKLEMWMDTEKPFLREGLQLDDAVSYLGTNRTTLSKTVNSRSGSTFPMYVNSKRIAYAKELFMQNPSYKMSELAFKSGFRSDVNFNTNFNIVEGMNPSDWCRNNAYKARRLLSKKKEQEQ